MPKTLTVGLGASGAMSRAVGRSVDVWVDRLPSVPFMFSAGTTPDLTVRFVPAISLGGDVQGEVHCQRQVYWGAAGNRYRIKGTILVRDNVDGRPITSAEAASVIEHELGHVLGLDDDVDSDRLMGPFVSGRPVNGPSVEELSTVKAFRRALEDVLDQVSHAGILSSRGFGRRGHRRYYPVRRQAS